MTKLPTSELERILELAGKVSPDVLGPLCTDSVYIDTQVLTSIINEILEYRKNERS